MRIKPDIGSVVGPSDRTHWGQAILQPAAYGVVELETSDARQDGIAILTQLGDQLKEPPVALSELRRVVDSLTHAGTKSIVVLVPVGTVIYIVLVGGGAVYLKRGEAISCLLSCAGALSGEVKEGDTLILASESLMRAVTEEMFITVFDHAGARDVAEKLTLFLHETGSPLGSAALIFQVSKLIPTEQEEPQKAAPVVTTQMPGKTVWRLSALVGQAEKLKFLIHPRLRRRLAPLRTTLRGEKRRLPVVAVVLIALFLISIAFGLLRRSRTAGNKQVAEAIVAAQHNFDEGTALMSLNPIKGRERLNQAKTILEPLVKSLPSKSPQGRSIAELYQKVTDNLSVAMRVIRTDPTLFFDPALLKKGGQATRVGLFETTIGLLDSANNAVYTVALPGKGGAIVGGGAGVSGATGIAVYDKYLYPITPTGIARIDSVAGQTIPSYIAASSQWGVIADIVAYGGNLYLLDGQKGRIWKYVATTSGFSEIREYLNPDTLPDLSRATGMAIDGSVWVGTSDGKIFRFTQGAENTFTPSGIEPGLGKYLMVYTNDTAKNVYILDRDNKRVVVVDKDGVYLAQYLWQTDLQPTQLAVSEAEKKILLLSGGKLYALDIQ